MASHVRSAIAALSIALSSVAAVAAQTPEAGPDVPTIAAAADLQFALRDGASAFQAETGRAVEIAFGSSGNFFRQIKQGAPFQMFLSADEAFVADLAEAGLTEDDGDLYAIGRIVIMIPRGSPLRADGTLQDLSAALKEGHVTKFAIANPEHAPYGRGAEEALRHAGLWEQLQEKLVLGENVAQAAQFATAGGADGGIIAYSLALATDVSRRGDYDLIPEDWHEPLRQRMVLMKGAGETARLFYRFVMSPAGRRILNRYGFARPGESM